MPDDSGSPASDRPIFIVGSNGSGTTLLRLLLDSHERIAIPPETGFLRLANAHRWVPYWRLGGQWASHLDLDDDALMTALAGFYGGLFSSYAERRGKARWGDKTPFHVWHLELANRLFPDCQVIGIVRHPGGVVASLRRRFRRGLPGATQHWRRSTAALLQGAVALGDRCAIVRYEELVLQPETTMRALLDWLGEPWSDAVLAHHEVQPAAQVEGFTRTDEAIDDERVAAWEKRLQGPARDRMVAHTATMAAFLGYTPDASSPLAALGDEPGRSIATGEDIRRRRLTHDAGIDWDRPPVPWHEDRLLRPPAPRRSSGPLSLDEVTIRELVRHRLTAGLARRLPERARMRAGEIRRSRPWLDRFLGPR
jgi:hypothetical protein